MVEGSSAGGRSACSEEAVVWHGMQQHRQAQQAGMRRQAGVGRRWQVCR